MKYDCLLLISSLVVLYAPGAVEEAEALKPNATAGAALPTPAAVLHGFIYDTMKYTCFAVLV